MNTDFLSAPRTGLRWLATLVLLLVVVLPMQFAEAVSLPQATLIGPVGQTITEVVTEGVGGPFISDPINAVYYENLLFVFDYDARKLDGTNDSFTYGWGDIPGDNDLGTTTGLTNETDDEIGTISVSLPPDASVEDLKVYVYVTADYSDLNDKVVLSNLKVLGDEKQVQVCQPGKGDEVSFTQTSLGMPTVLEAEEGESQSYIGYIIPSFYGYEGKNLEEMIEGFSGADWLANDCTRPSRAPSLTITAPASEGQTLSGTYTFEAEYLNDDEEREEMSWAVRVATENCGSSTTYAGGNLGDWADPASFDGEKFSATVDMSTWPNGDYCFVISPDSIDESEYKSEYEGEFESLREFVTFKLQNDSKEDLDDTEPVMTKKTTKTTGTKIKRSGRVAGIATTTTATSSTPKHCPLLQDYLRMGWDNDAEEVMKLQIFLHIFRDVYGGTENPVTGYFGEITDANVKAFQKFFSQDVLRPWYEQDSAWGLEPTGFVYKTTKWKINNLVCGGQEKMPSLVE